MGILCSYIGIALTADLRNDGDRLMRVIIFLFLILASISFSGFTAGDETSYTGQSIFVSCQALNENSGQESAKPCAYFSKVSLSLPKLLIVEISGKNMRKS